MSYSTKDDLLIGDIPLAPRYGDGSRFVDLAADEIDSQIGHIYVTPIALADTPENRPARLLLKKINNFIASGRIILDMALAGEDRELQSYGRSLLSEGLTLLKQVTNGDIRIPGADPLPGTEAATSGPTIVNEDPDSLVASFYDRTSGVHIFPPVPAAPYGYGRTYP